MAPRVKIIKDESIITPPGQPLRPAEVFSEDGEIVSTSCGLKNSSCDDGAVVCPTNVFLLCLCQEKKPGSIMEKLFLEIE